MSPTFSASTALSPDEILTRLEASGLRGRGGGWFPAHRKWRAVRVEGGQPFLVANGAEGEPGSIKDRHLLRTRPADILAGLFLAARAVGAREAVVFLKASFTREADAVRAAIATLPASDLAVRVAHGDDSYIVGEETALLEVLEGRRAWPRPKPPVPAAVGYEGRPTLIHNVETLLRVPAAIADPQAFQASESTYISLWGDVQRPSLHEVALGTRLRTIVETLGGGAREGVACVFPGGPSSPPLAEAHLDTPLDPDTLRAAGSSLGTGALLVVDRSRAPFDLAVSLASFFERESCGQCPPCVRGTESLHKVARALRTGEARARDLADVDEVAGFMAMHGYCAHCRAAAYAVKQLLVVQRPEVEGVFATAAHRDPGLLRYDPFRLGSAERSAIEALLS